MAIKDFGKAKEWSKDRIGLSKELLTPERIEMTMKSALAYEKDRKYMHAAYTWISIGEFEKAIKCAYLRADQNLYFGPEDAAKILVEINEYGRAAEICGNQLPVYAAHLWIGLENLDKAKELAIYCEDKGRFVEACEIWLKLENRERVQELAQKLKEKSDTSVRKSDLHTEDERRSNAVDYRRIMDMLRNTD